MEDRVFPLCTIISITIYIKLKKENFWWLPAAMQLQSTNKMNCFMLCNFFLQYLQPFVTRYVSTSKALIVYIFLLMKYVVSTKTCYIGLQQKTIWWNPKAVLHSESIDFETKMAAYCLVVTFFLLCIHQL